MRLLFLVAVMALGCAPALTSESLRPRGMDVFVSGGESDYQSRQQFGDSGSSKDWQMGVNFHWDLEYKDEYQYDDEASPDE